MQIELLEMELVAIRNMFLREMKDYLIALETATVKELRQRKDRIKILETMLEEKKTAIKNNLSLKQASGPD